MIDSAIYRQCYMNYSVGASLKISKTKALAL